MQYILMIYAQESGWANLTAAQQQEAMAAYGSYTEALRQAGIFESSRRLQPSSTAKAVRVTNGKTQVTDGPYAETKELLGGYYVIDVPDLDAALAWAARCPGASHGVVEVRAFWQAG